MVAVVIVESSSFFASFPSFAVSFGILVIVLRRNDAGPVWFRLRAGGSKAESSAGVRTWEATANTDADEVDEDTAPKECRNRVKA